jgi:RNA polymerase sigma-70 factor (sigma-E family)
VGDSEPTFEGFVAAHQRRLLRYAWMLTGDWHAAEDLVQSALVRIWHKWSRVSAAHDPVAYVLTIVTRTFVSGARRRRVREALTDPMSLFDIGQPATVDHADALADRTDLAQRLARLPSRQRSIVMLRFYEDWSVAETARAMGCSPGTVKSQTHKAMLALGRRVGEEEDGRSRTSS